MNTKPLELGSKTVALIQRLANEEAARTSCSKYVRARRGHCGACGKSISKHTAVAMEAFRVEVVPTCKPRPEPWKYPERDIRGMSDEQYWDGMADAQSY